MKFIILVLLISFKFIIFSQIEWAYDIDSNIYNTVSAVDGQDNLIISGKFSGKANFDLKEKDYFFDEPNGSSFIQKNQPSGKLDWVFKFSRNIYVSHINISSKGNIFLSGSFTEKVDFDFKNGYFEANSSIGEYDRFFLKLDENANFLWVKIIEGGTVGPGATGMNLDENENIFLGFSFIGGFDADPSSNVFSITWNNNTQYQEDFFVGKYSNTGDLIWANSFGSLGNDLLYNFNIDKLNNCYVSSAIGSQNYLIKIDNYGNVLWLKNLQDIGIYSEISNIQINSENNLIGINDFNVFKIDKEGNLIAKYKNQGWSYFTQFIIDKEDNVWVLGTYNDTIFLEDQNTDNFLVSNNNSRDVFLLKLSSNLMIDKSLSFGGINDDYAYDLIYTKSNKIYIRGEFYKTLDFPPNLYDRNLNSNGYSEFIAKLNLLLKSSNDEECHEFMMYPNPILDNLTVHSPFNKQMDIKLFNLIGDNLYWNDKENNTVLINFEEFKSASYYISIESEKCKVNKLLIKL
jgi:hypothetical protein